MNAKEAMDRALNECLREEGFSNEEMRALILRLVTKKLNTKDRALLEKRNWKARHFIH